MSLLLLLPFGKSLKNNILQRTITHKKNLVYSGFLGYIERYWYIILGLIISLPILLRYLKDANTATEKNDIEEEIKLNVVKNLNPIEQLTGMNKITTNQGYHKWALSLASNLGTLYSSRANWYNWIDLIRSATENDNEVYLLLKSVKNQSQKRVLSELYFFLTGRNLNEDVVKLLDKELLSKLPLFR